MPVKVITRPAGAGSTPPTHTHDTASHIDAKEGNLVVLDGPRVVAVYAPGQWVSAQVTN